MRKVQIDVEGSIGPVLLESHDLYSSKDGLEDSKETCIVRVPLSLILVIYMLIFQFDYCGDHSGRRF